MKPNFEYLSLKIMHFKVYKTGGAIIAGNAVDEIPDQAHLFGQ